MQVLRGRSNQITVSARPRRYSPAPLDMKLPSMIQRGMPQASLARCSNSAASDGIQPGFQYSASSDTMGMPVMDDSRRANVDLPDPDDPMTRMRCMTQNPNN